jgi:uncharacterized Zn finger protein
MSMATLASILSKPNLRSLAGERTFERGEEYFEEGQVGPIKEAEASVSAKVHGSRTYDVRLKVVAADRGKVRLDHGCTCPMGRDGDFCKHCVALGLAWIAKTATISATESAPGADRKSHQSVSSNEMRRWLENQSTSTLLDMLMAQVQSDARLREGLILKISRENARGIDLTDWKRDVRGAFHTGGHVDYYDVGEFAESVEAVLDSLERLLEEGFAAEAMLLAEYAADQAGRAVLDVDDSDGYFTGIGERIAALHLDACTAFKLDPLALAQRLFELEMIESELDLFDQSAQRYKALLGEDGLAEFRRLANAEWDKIKELKPGEKAGRSERERKITAIMVSLAKACGDVDALITIKKKSLSSSWNYLDLAEICKEAKRHDEALAWGEKGLAAFKGNPDNRLRDFVAEEYHRCKRYDDANRLYWMQFVEQPEPGYYKKLLGYAKKIKRSEAVRLEALQLLRKNITQEKNNPKTRYWHNKPDHSRLVEVFLWEKDGEQAWQEAQAGGCRNDLWRELADLRGETHPGDAATVYRRLIEPVIDVKKNDAYADAVKMLKTIRGWMKRAGQEREFATYYAGLKLRHKPKRNLMKLLEGFERG